MRSAAGTTTAATASTAVATATAILVKYSFWDLPAQKATERKISQIGQIPDVHGEDNLLGRFRCVGLLTA